MAGSLNRVMLIGNVGRDPEIRSTQGGNRIASLNIATSESWKDRNSGERKEKTEWHRVVVFGGLVDVVEKYVQKGTKLYLEGQLQTRKWQDQSGQDRYSTEVVLSQFGSTMLILSGGVQRDGGGGGGGGYDGGYGGGGSRGRNDDLDDEIPFVTRDASAEPGFRKCLIL